MKTTQMALWTLVAAVLMTADSISAQTWTQTSAPITNWQAIACSADGSKLVATSSGGIYTSTNFGVNWVLASNAPPVFASFPSIASSAEGNKLVMVCASNTPAGGSPSLIYVSADSGITWTQTSAPLGNWFGLASSADGNKLLVLENGGRAIYTSTNSGLTWQLNNVPAIPWSSAASSANGTKLVAIVGDPGTVYYPTNPGIIYTSTNSGATWVFHSVPNMFWNSIASSADGQKLVAGNNNGISFSIYTSSDSGINWTSNNVPAGAYPIVASSADGSTLMEAIPTTGNIYISRDSGISWTSAAAPDRYWGAIACSADGSRLTAVVRGGGIWTSQTTPEPSLNITPTNGNLILSWIIPSTDFVLQQNPDLTTTNWTDETNPPVLNLTNLQEEVTLPLTNDSGFYRLATP
ncbi:MAG TPA: hypothetical protein VJT54_01175 [Verrucomicrobiae bacterium]|nr:hypothetical protein [Verrucomicrobiae bacterium]